MDGPYPLETSTLRPNASCKQAPAGTSSSSVGARGCGWLPEKSALSTAREIFNAAAIGMLVGADTNVLLTGSDMTEAVHPGAGDEHVEAIAR